MKNLTLQIGYNPKTKHRLSTWYCQLCNKHPWLPTFHMHLYAIRDDGSIPITEHSIYFGIFKYYFRWAKVKGNWTFMNLTGC